VKSTPDELTVADVLSLKNQQMLVVNPEYQRGAVWTASQKKKLVDSVLRGYPIPLIYLHHITQAAGGLVSQRFEIIDGQQRINALADFADGAFKLFDPVKDEAEARFPEFIKRQPCPWAGKNFQDLEKAHRDQFVETGLRIVKIETDNPNEARDLFVRLQAGMPLNSQEKRDAWPGQFTDFVLRLGGKSGLAKYPGHDFFNDLMKAKRVQDRGKFRQLAAQLAILFFTHRETGGFRDINAPAIDDYYYEHLDFDASADDARRLGEVLDKLVYLLNDQKRPKIIGHEAIHLVLLIDSLLDDYSRSWEQNFASAFDWFRAELKASLQTRYDSPPSEFWINYGVGTRVNSDRADVIQRRHEFFVESMQSKLNLQLLDPRRGYGSLERELTYYQERKKCFVCGADVPWNEAEIHHVTRHSRGGPTSPDNGALVHSHCHPKSASAEAALAEKWKERRARVTPIPSEEDITAAQEVDDGEAV
jgi:hypothetical protein